MTANQIRGMHEQIQQNMADARKTPEYAQEADREWHMEHGVLIDANGEQIPHGLLDARHNAALAAVAAEVQTTVTNTFKRQLTDEREKTKQAWREHDDVVKALAEFSETIKQLGARNQQLRKQLAAAVEALKDAKSHLADYVRLGVNQPKLDAVRFKIDAALAKIGDGK